MTREVIMGALRILCTKCGKIFVAFPDEFKKSEFICRKCGYRPKEIRYIVGDRSEAQWDVVIV